MQWHWGNIGSFLAGLSTVVIALAALRQGPAAVRAWTEGKRAQADREREQAESIRLERQRGLLGWSAHGVNTYPVTEVTDPGELDQARSELAGGSPTAYVILRVNGDDNSGNANMANSLRQMVSSGGYVSRAPTPGEREALRAGLDEMGVPHASY
jgi:hypothetical protein